MSVEKILLDPEKLQDSKQTLDGLIQNLRDEASAVSHYCFGTASTYESRGPAADAMKKYAIEYSKTLNLMADTVERLQLLLLQGGARIEDMDTYLANAISGGAT